MFYKCTNNEYTNLQRTVMKGSQGEPLGHTNLSTSISTVSNYLCCLPLISVNVCKFNFFPLPYVTFSQKKLFSPFQCSVEGVHSMDNDTIIVILSVLAKVLSVDACRHLLNSVVVRGEGQHQFLVPDLKTPAARNMERSNHHLHPHKEVHYLQHTHSSVRLQVLTAETVNMTVF